MKNSGLQTILFIIFTLLLSNCRQANNKNAENEYPPNEKPVELTLVQAKILTELPLACISIEYPNHLHHLLSDKKDLKEPHALYPAFHGCFDWHSAVHAHWSLVKLLKTFPELQKADEIRAALLNNISKENILEEVAYFQKDQNKTFERTYGWAWLLKLSEELYTWDDSLARQLEENLLPLTKQITQMFLEFLPKLKYPVRVGEHNNTAFALSFVWDFATTTNNEELLAIISSKSMEFYQEDTNCPLGWEPGGYDFLSPCFEEIDLMRKILDKDDFDLWIKKFMPEITQKEFKIKVGEVTDRKDGKLVHLDGLNFSRAWVMYGLAAQYPEYNYLINIANDHIEYSLPNIVNDSYEGSHWLGTFAIYALIPYIN